MHIAGDQDFLTFVADVKKMTGIDLSQYKEAQMKRRLTSFREKYGHKSFASFFKEISANPKLLNDFLDRMTINVSEFFRNPGRWQVLSERIIPDLKKRKEGRPLKVWSAACSTGEEPYTLAILLQKYYQPKDIRVLATDIDEGVLAKAKEGIYHERSLKNMPPEQQRAFFQQVDGHFKINDEVKQCVTFKKQNLLSNPFDNHYDLIVCRNVIIYFTDEAKEQLFHKFSSALSTGGLLFVGSTEQIFHPQQYGFSTFDTFFYKKNE